MNLISFKSEDELIREGIERLEKTELTVSGSSGKIARLLLNIINSILGDEAGVYQSLRVNHLNAFLSTASNDGLDSIGGIVNTTRYTGESDEDFRYRISQSTVSLAKANETSVRLAALSVEGIDDIILKEFVFGVGSFVAYVITQYAITPEDIMEKVRVAINEVKGYGIKFEVLNPIVKSVKLNIILTFKDSTEDIDRSIIMNDAKSLIISYVNSLNLGEELDIYKLRFNVIALNSNLIDMLITSMRIDNKIVYVSNQQLKWNERFLASSAEGSVIIQGV